MAAPEAGPPSLQPASEDLVSLAGEAAVHRGLPVDLLQDIARRLQVLCWIVPIVGTAGTLATRITGTGVSTSFRFGGAVLFWAASLTVIVLVRRGRLPSSRLLDVGMLYGVVIAFIGAMVSVPGSWFAHQREPLLWSPVAVWVLIFPSFIPNTTRKALVAAVLAALTEPVAVMLYHAKGLGPFPPLPIFARAMWGNASAVAVAVVSSRVLYRLGEKLSATRALGSYHLEGLLGEGGMGQVYRATHRMLARPAAIKLIRPSVLGKMSAAEAELVFRRFAREAQATARLESKHTIEVYDFGLARDGTFYYVMELLRGLDLHELVTRYGPQPPERVVHILRQACHSLYEAHEHGLVHRDIKPGNIFLCQLGMDDDVAKVMDFGLVLPRSMKDEAGPALEADAMPVGTPLFMAPEAIMAGPDEAVDHRVDIYALGCTAYWLLAGRNVFEHSALAALMMAHVKQPPEPLATAAPQPVPPGLDAIVMACLEKAPDGRPATARELSDRLGALGIESAWTEERMHQWWALRETRAGRLGAE